MQTNNRIAIPTVFRPLLLSLVFSCMFITAEASVTHTELFSSQGPLFEQTGETVVPVKGLNLSKAWKTLRVGKEIDEKAIAKSPEKLAEGHAVLRLDNRTMVTLANGSSIQQALSETGKAPKYTITGAGHLLINEIKDQPSTTIHLNGFSVKTTNLHLFVNTHGEKPQLTVVTGSLEITVPIEKVKPAEKKPKVTDTTGDAAAEKTAPDPIPVVKELILEKVRLEAMDRIILEEKGYRLEKKTDLKTDPLLVPSTVPGFETPGPYRKSGKAGFEGEELQIKRYGKVRRLKHSPILLMEGDEITTTDAQTAVILLTDRDVIRLSQNATFTINEFTFKEKSVNSVLRFTGKIRAKIAKRKKRSRIRFKTATAVIGIKGTVFESTASAEATTVETVQGIVGVTDPEGKGEVLIKAGEMTSVAANELPKQPEPIPADRWQQLQQGMIPVAATTIVPLEKLTIVSPADNQSYTVPVLQLEVEPEEATLVFQMDGKPFVAENGDPLHHLSEGPHQLVVKGAAEGAKPQTVSFIVDHTTPALSPETQLDGFTLRQFMPLNLSWTESLASLNVLYNSASLPVTLSADGKIAAIDASSVFTNTTNGQVISLDFEARDPAGNLARFQKNIRIKFRPTTPPVISIDGGKQMIHLREARMITAMADREVEAWTITLDNHPLALQTPTAGQAETNKKMVTIPAHHFAQLAEGKHILSISGLDDFGLAGQQILNINVDRTPPVLIQPLELINPVDVKGETRMLTLKNLVVKEGESLALNWSEPLASVSFLLDSTGIQIPMVPVENMKTRLDAVGLKQQLGAVKTSTVTVTAGDAAGNTVQLKGAITFLHKPMAPLSITVKTASGALVIQEIRDVIAMSDRDIFRWQFTLDGKEIILPLPAIPPSGNGEKQITLQKSVFPKLADGDHKLVITGTDRFNTTGSGELTFHVDSKGPELAKISKNARLASLKLKKNEMLHLKWSEPLSTISATLEGIPWAVIHAADKTEVILRGDSDRLSFERKPFTLTATDEVGNSTQVDGHIALKKPRKMALRDSYNESILEMTRSSIDTMTLTNRPAFQLNESKPVIETKSIRLMEKIEFKQNPTTEFFDLLDEPLANSY